MKFANNRYYLSLTQKGEQAKTLLEDAYKNVKEIIDMDELTKKPTEYWFDIQNWIDEFILGITPSKIGKYKALLD